MNQFSSIASNTGGLLKELFQGPVVDQFNEDCAIYRGAEKGTIPFVGNQVNRPWRVRKNPGIGAGSDGGNMPAIGRQITQQAVINAKFNWLRFGITAGMISASKTDAGAFARGAAYELQYGYKDLKSNANRQMGWDGTGDLALMNTAAAGSSSLVIKGRESTEPALKFLDVGSQFDIYSGSTLVQSGITINAITAGDQASSTATITVDQAVTASADNVLVQTGSFGNEIQGLLTQLDGLTTTLYGVDRALYPITQGNVIDLSGGALSLDALQRSMDQAENRGGAGINAIYSDFASRRMYNKLLAADKRFENTMKGDGGFADKNKTYLTYNGIPWVADKDAPTRIFMLPQGMIEKHVLEEMSFADESGSQFIPQANVDALEVRLRFFANLFNAQPSASSVIRNYVSP